MKIGILSDTHGYFHPSFRELFAGADYILHAGDIGLMPVLEQLRSIAPVIAVRGNIDGEEFFDLPKLEHRVLDGISFSLIHNAGDIYHPAHDMHTRILSPTTDILISGHYHGYWCTQIKGTDHSVLWLSPGAAGNAGHHHERTALLLTTLPANERTGDIRHDISLEKINLGPRTFI
ncbi:MAG: metallophosphoesterase family protein [Proteobacteria bacterium]|jgi:putative phosphoesterase|nr:metallophosphoesterase family protein [Pseudomonadota bacterium]